MFSWFKKIKMIISMLIKTPVIFHDFIILYENFMALIYQENNFLNHKMKFLFIFNLKYIYLNRNIDECMLLGFKMITNIFLKIFMTFKIYFENF